jgi:hypothetical protein
VRARLLQLWGDEEMRDPPRVELRYPDFVVDCPRHGRAITLSAECPGCGPSHVLVPAG